MRRQGSVAPATEEHAGGEDPGGESGESARDDVAGAAAAVDSRRQMT
jgi:hypothetical protein